MPTDSSGSKAAACFSVNTSAVVPPPSLVGLLSFAGRDIPGGLAQSNRNLAQVCCCTCEFSVTSSSLPLSPASVYVFPQSTSRFCRLHKSLDSADFNAQLYTALQYASLVECANFIVAIFFETTCCATLTAPQMLCCSVLRES